jgi:hypothetical protein
MIASLILFLSLVLQFDGSLRPPREPIVGFTYTSVDGSYKLASCAAALHRTNNEGEEVLISLGGRLLPLIPGMTSADTEYEGLLLGLDWLIGELSSVDNNSILLELLGQDPTLIIRGDCKTIIDQLILRSAPRKVEVKYKLATERIDTIQQLHQQRNQMAGDVSLSLVPELSIRFEHVLRDKNRLCDAICKLTINHKQANIVEKIHELIRRGASMPVADPSSKSPKSNKKNKQLVTTNEFLQQAVNMICEDDQSVLLCHSSRLALTCELTKVAMQQKETVILSRIADFFLRVSRQWHRIYYIDDTNNTKKLLRLTCIGCDVVVLHLLGSTTKAEELASKHNIAVKGLEDGCLGVNAQLEQILSVSINAESPAQEQCNDVSSPYRDISHLIEDASARDALFDWNSLIARSKEIKCYDLENGVWLQSRIKGEAASYET